MAMDIKEVETLIKEALPDAIIEIQDLEEIVITTRQQ